LPKRKRRYFVDVPSAIKFLGVAYGIKAKEVNYYHLKLRHPEFKGVFDWYHTQGTMVVQTELYASNIGEAGSDEEAALLIIRYIEQKNENC
jgi:hypothetical protein